jgi:hypothetical protein
MARFRLIMYIAGGANRDPRVWRAALVDGPCRARAATIPKLVRKRVVGNGNTVPHQSACHRLRCRGGRVGDMLARKCVLMQRAGRSRLGSHGSDDRSQEASMRVKSCMVCDIATVSALEHRSCREWRVCWVSNGAVSGNHAARQMQPFSPRSATWGGCWSVVITGLPTGVRSARSDGAPGLARKRPCT